MTSQITTEQRKEAGLKIDPETAEVYSEYVGLDDPYNLNLNQGRTECIGRVYFARSPGSDIWVGFFDLPGAMADALRQKMSTGDIVDLSTNGDWF